MAMLVHRDCLVFRSFITSLPKETIVLTLPVPTRFLAIKVVSIFISTSGKCLVNSRYLRMRAHLLWLELYDIFNILMKSNLLQSSHKGGNNYLRRRE